MSANESVLENLRNMARAIREAVRPFSEADGERAEAQDAVTAKRDAANGKRETMMRALASLSSAGGWSPADIDTATNMACGVAVSNESLPKSVATFVGECRKVMHPLVRDGFPHLSNLRSEVWALEKETKKANKDARTPLMDACQREYHAVVQMCGAVIKGEAVFNTTADVISWAEARDPALDPKKQADKIASILDQLAAISNIFPDRDLLAGIDTLKAVTADALAKARADLLGRDEARLAAHPLSPIPTVVVERVADATQPNEHAADTAADVLMVNPIDAALAEMDMGMAAG